jgi:hypothetical protein
MDSTGDLYALRPARTLLGWLDPDEAIMQQSGRQTQNAEKHRSEYELRYRQARSVARARPLSVDRRSVVTEAPAAMRQFTAEFEAEPKFELRRAEGWRVALVDLRGVCAMQPTVNTDTQLPEVDPEDFAALAAEITLKMPPPLTLNVNYEKERKAWMIVAPTPNFRIETQFETVVDGNLGLGFTVRLNPSFMSVVGLRDRYVLKDGYHRALAFLARGINVVPAIVKENGSIDDIGRRPGNLSPSVWLAANAPTLPDFFDDDVSVAVRLPEAKRLIMIQAVETTLTV